MSPPDRRAAPLRLWLSTLPVVTLLLIVLAYGSGGMIHGQLLRFGEVLWPGYHELRGSPEAPTCDPESFTAAKAEEEDPDDPLSGLLDEEDEAEAPEAKDDGAEDGDALFDELLGEEEGPADDEAAKQAAAAARKRCEEKHAAYASITSRQTPGLKRYQAFEGGVSRLIRLGFNYQKTFLILLLLLCAVTATGLRSHISLRPERTRKDVLLSESLQLLVNLALAHSAYTLLQIQAASGAEGSEAGHGWLWVTGFLAMAVLSGVNLAKARHIEEAGGFGGALLSVPLYTAMGLMAGAYFLLIERHPAGMAIYLGKLTEHASIYLQVGLYVWVGMLLKRTVLARRVFDVLRPWGMSPELLAFVVVVGAALPTAYSGASGIFVLAAGALIYDEMIRGGARNQLALATAALSGSLGVVLRPCLLVVIVASLNKQVTTDELYGWGLKVFLLSAVLFLGIALLARDGPLRIRSPREAAPESLAALKPLIPYGVIFGLALLFYHFGLEAHLDEHTAPQILPVILLLLLIYDRAAARTQHRAEEKAAEEEAPEGFWGSLSGATTETTGYIGALLILMALSVALGGVVERADVMSMVPQTFGSVWVTMLVLVTVLVVVGMTMDPYGAVILVSATIAAVAERNGINPVHFWMVVLAAFELGYLTPPVALNHLLVRQVVGEEAFKPDPALEGRSFWRRHERILLPVVAKGVVLLIVAFIPLMF